MTSVRGYNLPKWVQFSCLGLLFFGIVMPGIISLVRGDYNISANYISELGATDAAYSGFVNAALFPLIALCTFLIIVHLWRGLRGHSLAKLGLLAITIGFPLGYISAAIFPCDYGCPIEGSAAQDMHNLTAVISYTIAALGFFLLFLGLKNRVRPRTRLAVLAVAIIMVVGFFMMLSPDQAPYRGLWQRSADYGAFLILIALAFRIRAKA